MCSLLQIFIPSLERFSVLVFKNDLNERIFFVFQKDVEHAFFWERLHLVREGDGGVVIVVGSTNEIVVGNRRGRDFRTDDGVHLAGFDFHAVNVTKVKGGGDGSLGFRLDGVDGVE